MAAAAAAASAYSQPPHPFEPKSDHGHNGNSSMRYPLGSRRPRGSSPGAGSSEGSSPSPNSPLQLTTNRYIRYMTTMGHRFRYTVHVVAYI